MARIRTIKPEFWDSPGTARASYKTRLFFIAMWNWADDWGIGVASPKQLIAFAFPNDDDVSAKDFPTLAKEVSECFDVEFYEVAGRPYYCIPSWDLHQRTERKAKRTNPGPEQAENRLFTGISDLATEIPTVAKEVPAWEKEKEREKEREQGKEIMSADADVIEPYSQEFETFWKIYPRHIGKRAAWMKWNSLLKSRTVSAREIIAGASRFASDPNLPIDGAFIPHPATWLNAGRWEDEPLPARIVETKAQRNLSTVDYFESVERLAVEA